jgi:hypothetical protein
MHSAGVGGRIGMRQLFALKIDMIIHNFIISAEGAKHVLVVMWSVDPGLPVEAKSCLVFSAGKSGMC